MSKCLQTKDLTLAYGERTIIDQMDLDIPKGEITVFIGGNGCGKSTLLRSIARLMKPKEGSVLLDGESISRLSTKEVARKMAILPQTPVSPEGLTVLQLVKQGRYPHQSWLKQWSRKDEEIVEDALRATGMEEFRDRKVDELSGGQRQRAWIALTLAQDTDIILLDEPTTYLDMTHQIEILDLLFELNEREGRTIVMVLHDINLACRYAHNIVAIRDREVYAQGKPEEVISCELVKHVFGMDCQVSSDPLFGTPLCIPFGKGRCILKPVGVTG
ncbi:ABC transporter ATP-binding protein [Rossellomorea marisflavi]|jgi:iron complex transport system ATP-binding protein|uniref:ABC transporter n=1 Tax=Rossellomorea marisflavi TaxID=189381 RepID=A0A0M0G2Q6_9BACI|nr:ABC transporter ATP-binding protein [Rossellomorea marisflavi]KON83882.1 ABC transporter [Rossellomorea marisflavi]MCM2590958.1 ABC transporter ATP-binding protein [Rossellomorea marisflavi]MDR4935678.1 ABC transporter ATP-binding protein [Rossellomorea marisflavi]VXB34017.1 iron(III)-siderophore transporter (ATP binding component) [Bacillus sp. 349Y]